jgi:hypothetical protein
MTLKFIARAYEGGRQVRGFLVAARGLTLPRGASTPQAVADIPPSNVVGQTTLGAAIIRAIPSVEVFFARFLTVGRECVWTICRTLDK